MPPVPPEPTLSERFAGLGYRLEDTEEDTFIRPETMLRRALMAIDPAYADRTEIRTDGEDDDASPVDFVPKRPYVESEESVDGVDVEQDTAKRRAVDDATSLPDLDPSDETTRERVGDIVAAAAARKSGATTSLVVPGIAAFRVAVLPIPEEGDVRLLFLPPGAAPPPGVAVALLVPPSEEDARMINEIYKETDAKL